MNKGIGDGHALNENNHTTQDKIKGNTYTCFIEALTGNFEGEQKSNMYQEFDAYISVKDNLKKHLSFWKEQTKQCVAPLKTATNNLLFTPLQIRNSKTIFGC